MFVTLRELAELVGGRLVGDGELLISGAATIRDARQGEITLADFKIVFLAIALLMASSALGFRRLKPEDGWQVSGYRGEAR